MMEDAPVLKILGISGSLRQQSYNTALLRAAQDLLPPDVQLDVATLHGIPLYDGDVEARDGIPEAVRALKARIMASDALLLATPEYNSGMPGVFKNAIDWLSRPPADSAKVFGNKPVALLGASPGGFGTISSQTAWLPVLRALGMQCWSNRLLVSRAHQLIDSQGALGDEATRKQLSELLAGFAAFASKR